jgi:hypothetical protein
MSNRYFDIDLPQHIGHPIPRDYREQILNDRFNRLRDEYLVIKSWIPTLQERLKEPVNLSTDPDFLIETLKLYSSIIRGGHRYRMGQLGINYYEKALFGDNIIHPEPPVEIYHPLPEEISHYHFAKELKYPLEQLINMFNQVKERFTNC